MKSQTAAQRYRRKAEECELKAKRAEKWVDQEAWLRLALDWKKLARLAEQRTGYRPAWSPLMRESPSRSSSSAASSSACGFYFAFSSASNPRSNCMPFLIPRRIALALRDQLFVTCDVFVVHEWLHFNLRLLDTIQGLLRGTPGKSVERVTIASLDARPHRALSRHHSIARGTGSLGDQEFAIFRNHPSATSATKEKPLAFQLRGSG
jgi:hypothetical protein